MNDYIVEMLNAIKEVYELAGIENPDVVRDIDEEYLTENEARNCRSVLWYHDGIKEAAVYIDTLEALSEEEIDAQLC